MARHGFPIWYELVTPDPEGAKAFYEAVADWTIAPPPPHGPDYRMISAADGGVGGVLRLDDAMKAAGAQPTWLMYVGVEDVDATAEQARSLGASVLVPPTDIPGVGRFAFLADPQGAPFYIMHGASDGQSGAFSYETPGHVSWNELSTTDGDAALAFYGTLFGWENRETMDMGPMGGYHFLDTGETRLGALVTMQGRPAGWRLYIRVADIDAAADRVTTQGGSIHMGPHEVPNGDVILIGTDPQGAPFSLVGLGKNAG